jgi:NAD(P)-dependent dehydrogenase (short-subunit alcohol dehydrogenase family)
MTGVGRLEGKVAIVTGAALGIGAASAALFAREGARVVVSDRDGDGAESVAAEITASGGTAIGVAADVTVADDVRQLVQTAVSEFGGLDVLYCNAGRVLTAYLEETNDADARGVFDVNVFGVVSCVQEALPHLRERKGNIVITASKVGIVAQNQTPIYNASKGAVIALTKSLAIDYAHEGIRVNCVCPGIVDTKLFRDYIDGLPDPAAALAEHEVAQPLGRLATAEDCASAALFLASDDAGFITGVPLLVDGGYAAR